jgi:hypothetical protein
MMVSRSGEHEYVQDGLREGVRRQSQSCLHFELLSPSFRRVTIVTTLSRPLEGMTQNGRDVGDYSARRGRRFLRAFYSRGVD